MKRTNAILCLDRPALAAPPLGFPASQPLYTQRSAATLSQEARRRYIYSSSSSSPSSSSPPDFLEAALAFFLLHRPGRPPPKGLERAKSMCFWLSTRTRNEGTLTICFPTLQGRRKYNFVRLQCGPSQGVWKLQLSAVRALYCALADAIGPM